MASEQARILVASGTCQPPSFATDARPPSQREGGVHGSPVLQSGPAALAENISEQQPSRGGDWEPG